VQLNRFYRERDLSIIWGRIGGGKERLAYQEIVKGLGLMDEACSNA